MKPSEEAKAAGFKNLKEFSEYAGQTTETLRNWHKDKRQLFDVVLAGAIQKKKEMS